MSQKRSPGHFPEASPEPTLRHALRHVSRAFHRLFSVELARYGLTEAMYLSMFALRRIPHMSSAELARWTGVSPQNANQVLKTLIDRGLVERTPAEDHGRILESQLTEKGLHVIVECEHAAGEIEALMTSEMTASEKESLEKILRVAARALGSPIADRREAPNRLQPFTGSR